MFYIDFTASDSNIYRIDNREAKITAISPSQKLCYSHIDLDTLFSWRAEADEKNLQPEAENAFFMEKLEQLLLRQLYIRKLPLTRYCRSNNCHAFRLPRKGREKRHFNHLINAALQSSVYGHFIAALIISLICSKQD